LVLGTAVKEEKIIGAMFAPLLTINNTGAPSILEGWKLSVVSHHYNVSQLSPQFIQDKIVLPMQNGQPTVTIRGSDALYDKAETKPVATGDHVRGWLCFILAGADAKQLREDKARIEIQFVDVNGKSHSVSHALGEGKLNTLGYYPGVSFPIDQPTTQPSPTAGKEAPEQK
jgi:hypothetical protein